MYKFIDETGNQYGRLKVLASAGRESNGSIKWECICECGNKTTVNGTSLRSKHTKSCGCLQKEIVTNRIILPPGEAGFRAYLGVTKRAAKIRSYDWFLKDDQVREITQRN